MLYGMTTLVRSHAHGSRRSATKIIRGEHQPPIHRVVMISQQLVGFHNLDVTNSGPLQNMRSDIGAG
jgi:hypothetical protein